MRDSPVHLHSSSGFGWAGRRVVSPPPGSILELARHAYAAHALTSSPNILSAFNVRSLPRPVTSAFSRRSWQRNAGRIFGHNKRIRADFSWGSRAQNSCVWEAWSSASTWLRTTRPQESPNMGRPMRALFTAPHTRAFRLVVAEALEQGRRRRIGRVGHRQGQNGSSVASLRRVPSWSTLHLRLWQ